jgi:reactive intermediate/imine deaminase
MTLQIIHADAAPRAIGCYSQAVKVGNIVHLSGQIGLVPDTMQLVEGMEAQAHQIFKNLTAIVAAAGGNLSNIVKLTIYLTDMANFPLLNQTMAEYFAPPYPARAAVGVKELPRGALVEVEGIAVV